MPLYFYSHMPPILSATRDDTGADLGADTPRRLDTLKSLQKHAANDISI